MFKMDGFYRCAIRSVAMKTYIAVFEIDDAAKVARILRYFHSSENYANKL